MAGVEGKFLCAHAQYSKCEFYSDFSCIKSRKSQVFSYSVCLLSSSVAHTLHILSCMSDKYQQQTPHTWRALHLGRQKYFATLEHTSYESSLLALMPGRPEINELFVGYTHFLRLCTPRPHVCKQRYWVFSLCSKVVSFSPECSGEILYLHLSVLLHFILRRMCSI